MTSELALYRRYRSQTFNEVIGQPHIVQILTNALRRDQVRHAYLFFGTRGTGKTSVARILAKALNCRNGVSPEPCLQCDLCDKIRQGVCVDVLEIDAASNRGVDEMRNLRERIAYVPVEGRFKVYIIDEVHMLTHEAFNALLKTLEEPPAHTVFILATTEVHKVPDTIASRCQRLGFRRLSISDIVRSLNAIVQKQSIAIDENALQLIAENADGSMRDALSLLDQIAAYGLSRIESAQVKEILGVTEETWLYEFTAALSDQQPPRCFQLVADYLDSGRAAAHLIRDMGNYFHDCVLFYYGQEHLIQRRSERAQIKQLNVDVEFLKRGIRIWSRVEGQLRWHSNHRLILEAAVMEMLMDTAGKQPPQLGGAQSISPSPESAAQTVAPSTELDLAVIKHYWNDILEAVKQRRMPTYVLLCEAEPIRYDHPDLTLAFQEGFSFHKEKLKEDSNRQLVEECVHQAVGVLVGIRFSGEGAEDTAIAASSRSAGVSPSEPAAELIKMFNGKLV